MASNSSNTTAVEYVGWQTAPHTRGTMGILLNCTSVILLITWTSFHPCIGISRKQRILTTITAIFVPIFTVMVASKDFICAYRLWQPLHEMEGWKDGWTLTKSFLVVKGGIRVKPHHKRRHTKQSSCGQSSNSTSAEILDPDTFLQLARVGSVRYQDFPTSMEIHDKSKADWFAKSIALLQLLWVIVNIGCRRGDNLPISLMEEVTLDWITFGLLASILWLKCPQNVEIPYDVPVRTYRQLAAESQSEYNPGLSEVLLRHWFTANPDYGNLAAKYELLFTTVAIIVFFPVLALAIGHLATFYQFRSAHAAAAWQAFTCASMLSTLGLMTDCAARSARNDEYIEKKFVKMLMLDPSESSENKSKSASKWLNLTIWIGFYDETDVVHQEYESNYLTSDFHLGFVVVFGSVSWLSQFAKLVIALTAFANAPRAIYDVPGTWVLEALIHVGG